MGEIVYSIKCWFEGHVQGVGFRYQTVAIAKGYDVTGTVSNMDDGRVFIHAEGEQTEVTAFMAEIESEMSSFIRRTEIKNATGPRDYNSFSISQK